MLDRLTAVKIRWGIACSRRQQMLSALVFLSLLVVNLANGFDMASLYLRFSSRIASSPGIGASDNASAKLLTSPPNWQRLTQKLSPSQEASRAPRSGQGFDQLLPETGAKAPALSLSLVSAIPPRLPEKVAGLDSEERKKLFIDLLLPTILVALEEVKQERQHLLTIISELGGVATDLSFSEKAPAWQHQIGADKSKFVLGLTKKYRTESAEMLLFRINVLPPSLIIAQGAMESGWGSSRIAIEVNNLFGMYANVASGQTSSYDGDNTPKIIEYKTILDSVRSYVLNINRQSAYNELRQIRRQTLDPMLIAEGLTQYSERKEFYIADLKQIIAHNNLQDLDTLVLGAV